MQLVNLWIIGGATLIHITSLQHTAECKSQQYQTKDILRGGSAVEKNTEMLCLLNEILSF